MSTRRTEPPARTGTAATGTPLAIMAPRRPPRWPVGPREVTRVEALLAGLLDELRLIRESTLRQEESQYRAEKLHVLSLVDQGIGVESRVAVTPVVSNDPAAPSAVFRNRLARTIGAAVEVTIASATAGAQAFFAHHAPIPADVVGARSPVVVLAPNEEITLRLTNSDVRVELVITDPLAALYE